jgi:hypothetical protein
MAQQTQEELLRLAAEERDQLAAEEDIWQLLANLEAPQDDRVADTGGVLRQAPVPGSENTRFWMETEPTELDPEGISRYDRRHPAYRPYYNPKFEFSAEHPLAGLTGGGEIYEGGQTPSSLIAGKTPGVEQIDLYPDPTVSRGPYDPPLKTWSDVEGEVAAREMGYPEWTAPMRLPTETAPTSPTEYLPESVENIAEWIPGISPRLSEGIQKTHIGPPPVRPEGDQPWARALRFQWGFGKGISKNAWNLVIPGLFGMALDIPGAAMDMTTNASLNSANLAVDAELAGDWKNAARHTLAAQVPMIGPIADAMTDKAQQSETYEQWGEVAADIVVLFWLAKQMTKPKKPLEAPQSTQQMIKEIAADSVRRGGEGTDIISALNIGVGRTVQRFFSTSLGGRKVAEKLLAERQQLLIEALEKLSVELANNRVRKSDIPLAENLQKALQENISRLDSARQQKWTGDMKTAVEDAQTAGRGATFRTSAKEAIDIEFKDAGGKPGAVPIPKQKLGAQVRDAAVSMINEETAILKEEGFGPRVSPKETVFRVRTDLQEAVQKSLDEATADYEYVANVLANAAEEKSWVFNTETISPVRKDGKPVTPPQERVTVTPYYKQIKNPVSYEKLQQDLLQYEKLLGEDPEVIIRPPRPRPVVAQTEAGESYIVQRAQGELPLPQEGFPSPELRSTPISQAGRPPVPSPVSEGQALQDLVTTRLEHPVTSIIPGSGTGLPTQIVNPWKQKAYNILNDVVYADKEIPLAKSIIFERDLRNFILGEHNKRLWEASPGSAQKLEGLVTGLEAINTAAAKKANIYEQLMAARRSWHVGKDLERFGERLPEEPYQFLAEIMNPKNLLKVEELLERQPDSRPLIQRMVVEEWSKDGWKLYLDAPLELKTALFGPDKIAQMDYLAASHQELKLAFGGNENALINRLLNPENPDLILLERLADKMPQFLPKIAEWQHQNLAWKMDQPMVTPARKAALARQYLDMNPRVKQLLNGDRTLQWDQYYSDVVRFSDTNKFLADLVKSADEGDLIYVGQQLELLSPTMRRGLGNDIIQTLMKQATEAPKGKTFARYQNLWTSLTPTEKQQLVGTANEAARIDGMLESLEKLRLSAPSKSATKGPANLPLRLGSPKSESFSARMSNMRKVIDVLKMKDPSGDLVKQYGELIWKEQFQGVAFEWTMPRRRSFTERFKQAEGEKFWPVELIGGERKSVAFEQSEVLADAWMDPRFQKLAKELYSPEMHAKLNEFMIRTMKALGDARLSDHWLQYVHLFEVFGLFVAPIQTALFVAAQVPLSWFVNSPRFATLMFRAANITDWSSVTGVKLTAEFREWLVERTQEYSKQEASSPAAAPPVSPEVLEELSPSFETYESLMPPDIPIDSGATAVPQGGL